MSRLIRIFTVRLVNLFFIPIFEIRNKLGRCPNLAVFPNIPDFTLNPIKIIPFGLIPITWGDQLRVAKFI